MERIQYAMIKASSEVDANKRLSAAIREGWVPEDITGTDNGHVWIMFTRRVAIPSVQQPHPADTPVPARHPAPAQPQPPQQPQPPPSGAPAPDGVFQGLDDDSDGPPV